MRAESASGAVHRAEVPPAGGNNPSPGGNGGAPLNEGVRSGTGQLPGGLERDGQWWETGWFQDWERVARRQG